MSFRSLTPMIKEVTNNEGTNEVKILDRTMLKTQKDNKKSYQNGTHKNTTP